MKLKYYLRGIGIGVVVTTFIFMILISLHKNDSTQRTDISVQDTESRTVAQASIRDTEFILEQETETEAVPETEEKPQEAGAALAQNQPEKPAGQDEPVNPGGTAPENSAEGETPKAPEPSGEPETPEEPEEHTPAQPEKVRIEISGGQFSDAVSKKLEEAGLVDSAKAFNDFLVQKKYDNAILPGVYEIPKDATYEEIAVLLTTKVR